MNQNNLWEEKNLIEQKKNLKNSLISAPNDTMKEIKKNVIEKGWKDIGNKKIHQKLCSKCNTNQVYKSLKLLKRAIKKNVLCKKCALNGRIIGCMTDEHKLKLSISHKKNGIGKWMNGKTLTDKTKEKISNSHKGKKLTTLFKKIAADPDKISELRFLVKSSSTYKNPLCPNLIITTSAIWATSNSSLNKLSKDL